jgi:hypothetical protein
MEGIENTEVKLHVSEPQVWMNKNGELQAVATLQELM